jgi:hypothetical protein
MGLLVTLTLCCARDFLPILIAAELTRGIPVEVRKVTGRKGKQDRKSMNCHDKVPCNKVAAIDLAIIQVVHTVDVPPMPQEVLVAPKRSNRTSEARQESC